MKELVTTADTASLDAVVRWLFRVEPREEVRKYIMARALYGKRFTCPDDLIRGIVDAYRNTREGDVLG